MSYHYHYHLPTDCSYSPSCAPSRASFLTGNTLRRTGIEGNEMVREGGSLARLSRLGNFISDKVEALRSFEQVLSESHGFQTESIGKWYALNK